MPTVATLRELAGDVVEDPDDISEVLFDRLDPEDLVKDLEVII